MPAANTAQKKRLRQQVRQRIVAMQNQQEASQQIIVNLQQLDVYRSAAAVHVYVNLPGEVQTQTLLTQLLASGRRVYVPYCVAGNRLQLFHLKNQSELTPGAYGILEPTAELQADAARRGDAAELDLIIVPGVAFDRSGGRLGRGKGYYDRLLATRRSDATVAALAFDCQLVPQVPVSTHDQPMSLIVTETTVVAPHAAGS